MVEQKPANRSTLPEGTGIKRALRVTAVGAGIGTLLYAASAIDALAHGETNAAIQETENTARMGVVTSLIIGAEVYLRRKR